MNKHVGGIVEVINRNVLVSLLLKQGYNVFLPVYDDGIDFIIHRGRDDAMTKVQLKSRWTVSKKHLDRGISIAFPYRGEWYLVPHDELIRNAPESVFDSRSWIGGGEYSTPAPSARTMASLRPFRLQSIEVVAEEASNIADDASTSGHGGMSTLSVWDELSEIRRRNPPQSLSVQEILEMRDEGRG